MNGCEELQTKNISKFSHALSSYAGKGYDIYILMTALAENIKKIRNQKSLTFLYRAKVKELDALNITAIRSDYQNTLGINREWAEELAYRTKGYSLAYQIVGYLYWNALSRAKDYSSIDRKALDRDLCSMLADLAYDKIWDELSPQDRNIVFAMTDLQKSSGEEAIKVELIREKVKMSSDTFTQYRSRLIDSGIVDGSQYGYLRFKLPVFEDYVEEKQYR